MTENSPLFQDLRQKLVRAAAEQATSARLQTTPAARSIWRKSFFGIAISAMAFGALSLATFTPANAASVKIQKTPQLVTVTIVNSKVTPTQITKEMERSGLRARVQTVPVADPLVGRFVNMETTESQLGLEIDQPEPDGSQAISFPTDALITLHFGRPAKQGEQYAMKLDALTYVEQFRCKGIYGEEYAKISARFDKQNLQFRWFLRDKEGQLQELAGAPPAHAYVQSLIEVASNSYVGIAAVTKSYFGPPPNVPDCSTP